MDTQPAGPFKVGDRVKIISPGGMKGRVVELRGPLGPKGAQVFRIKLRGKPKPAYIEVLEEQLEAIPALGDTSSGQQ